MATCHLYAECFQGEGAEFGDDGDGKSKEGAKDSGVFIFPIKWGAKELLRVFQSPIYYIIDNRKDTGQKTWETHQQALKYIEILRTLPG